MTEQDTYQKQLAGRVAEVLSDMNSAERLELLGVMGQTTCARPLSRCR